MLQTVAFQFCDKAFQCDEKREAPDAYTSNRNNYTLLMKRVPALTCHDVAFLIIFERIGMNATMQEFQFVDS